MSGPLRAFIFLALLEASAAAGSSARRRRRSITSKDQESSPSSLADEAEMKASSAAALPVRKLPSEGKDLELLTLSQQADPDPKLPVAKTAYEKALDTASDNIKTMVSDALTKLIAEQKKEVDTYFETNEKAENLNLKALAEALKKMKDEATTTETAEGAAEKKITENGAILASEKNAIANSQTAGSSDLQVAAVAAPAGAATDVTDYMKPPPAVETAALESTAPVNNAFNRIENMLDTIKTAQADLKQDFIKAAEAQLTAAGELENQLESEGENAAGVVGKDQEKMGEEAAQQDQQADSLAVHRQVEKEEASKAAQESASLDNTKSVVTKDAELLAAM